MEFLLGLYGDGGGGRRTTNAKGGEERRRLVVVVAAASRAVRQLYCKLRSTWRRSAALRSSKRRHAGGAARFGYDLESYSRNFDDGRDLVSGGYHLSAC